VGSTLQLTFNEAFQRKHIIIYDTTDGTKEYVENDFSPRHYIIPQADLDKYDLEHNFVRVEVEDVGRADLADLRKEVSDRKPASLEIVEADRERPEHLVEDARAILSREEEMMKRYLDHVGCDGFDRAKLLEKGKQIVAGAQMPKDENRPTV
jgi:hypothetical protein